MSNAITGTLQLGTELGGRYKLVVVTATVASASDTITLTAATHGITAITSIVGAVITGGIDDAFTMIQVTFSGLELTVVSKGQDGLDADDFTGTTISIAVIGTM